MKIPHRYTRIGPATVIVLAVIAGLAIAAPLILWLGRATSQPIDTLVAGASGSVSAPVAATAAASQVDVPTSSPVATHSASPDVDAAITLIVRGVGGLEGAVQFATLAGGPTDVYHLELDEVETIQLVAGDYELIVYNSICDANCDNLGSADYDCSTSLSLAPGDSLLIRMDLSAEPCLQEVAARPRPPSDPESITGRFDIGQMCAYVVDVWGYYWEVTWPSGFRVARAPSWQTVLKNASGKIVALPADIIRVRGTRRGAEPTGCATDLPWIDAEGIGYQAVDVTIIDPYPHTERTRGGRMIQR